MGKNKNKKDKNRKKKEEEQFFAKKDLEDFSYTVMRVGAKAKSKLERKNKKKLRKQGEQIKRHKTQEISRCGFHKVSAFIATDDDRIDKKFILSRIKKYMTDPFSDLGCFRTSNTLEFYFDADKEIADAIQSLSNKIRGPNGERIGLKVEFVHKHVQDIILNCDQIEILKNLVFQRFNLSNGVLDLSSLHLDPRLVESNTFAPLCNESILEKTLSFVSEMQQVNPEVCVRAFDLSNNKLDDSCLNLLSLLDHSSSIAALNLENNNFKNINCLQDLSFFPNLEELKLIGNVFKNCKMNKKEYARDVKKLLPFLKILDGVDLNLLLDPKTRTKNSNMKSLEVVADIQSSRSFVTEENMKTFLEQYYSLFDTPNRETLLQAYVPTAKIELISQNPLVPNRIFEGQIAVQEFLNSWPLLKHDHSSFSLEVLKLSPEEGISQVQGSCMVVEPQVSLKFKRIMKIVPYNTGFCCVEDTLWIL